MSVFKAYQSIFGYRKIYKLRVPKISMEKQITLFENSGMVPVVNLPSIRLGLEQEKEKFIREMCTFLEPLNLESLQIMGRPRANFRDVIKSLLMMSYNGMSYRRTQSDLRWMLEKDLVSSLIPRSTLNDYVNDPNTKVLLEKLIQASALFFSENDNTLIIDSTWLATRMYIGGHKRVHDKKNCNFEETRKLHVGVLKNSKVIAVAKATPGNVHDAPLFKDIVESAVKNGLDIKSVLADAGYTSKEHYAFCRDLGIREVYIDFRSNAKLRNAKSDIWREKLKLYKEQQEVWHESYRYRAIVEGVFAAIKKKNVNFLRSKKGDAQDVELLLKAMVYNLTIIAKYA